MIAFHQLPDQYKCVEGHNTIFEHLVFTLLNLIERTVIFDIFDNRIHRKKKCWLFTEEHLCEEMHEGLLNPHLTFTNNHEEHNQMEDGDNQE